MPSSADRNLLFGALALQMNFVNREQLIAAVSAPNPGDLPAVTAVRRKPDEA